MQSLETLLKEGKRWLAAGDRKQALARFEVATRIDSTSERAWLGIAQASDNRDQAIDALGQVLSLNPESMEARKLRLSLQVANLRAGVSFDSPLYRENPFKRLVRPLFIGVLVLALVVVLFLSREQLLAAVGGRLFTTNVAALPVVSTIALPGTWTPTSTFTPTSTPAWTDTPIPTATSNIVVGRTNGTVNARSGPGTNFAVVGSLSEQTAVVVTAQNFDSSFFQVHQTGDDTLVWVAATFVDVTGGDMSILPRVDVPTPVPTSRPPTRVSIPPSPTIAPIYIYSRSKYSPNPHGPRCNRTLVQGTIWNNYRIEPREPLPGIAVRVWVNGSIYQTDISGSHGSANLNTGYWEVDFALHQPVTGLVAVVSSDGQLLSPQYEFTLTGGDCSQSSSVNEIIIDFSH